MGFCSVVSIIGNSLGMPYVEQELENTIGINLVLSFQLLLLRDS